MSTYGPDIFEGEESDTPESELLSRLRSSLASESPVSSNAATAVSQHQAYRPKPAATVPHDAIRVIAESDDSFDDFTSHATGHCKSSGRNASSHHDSGAVYDEDDHEHPEDAQLLLSETEQIETEFVVGLSRDRAQRIQKVATDTLSVHSMFAQLSDLVASASAVFDDLEANVTAVRDDTVQAQKDLEQSNRYLLAKRQRMCCLICCLVLVMIVVGICLSIVTK